MGPEEITQPEFNFFVDIPQLNVMGNPNDEWINVESFATREEAIAYAKEHFGADDNGMICIVTP